MFLNNVIDNNPNWLSINIDLSAFLIGMLGIYFAYLTYKQSKNDIYMQSRYEKVILDSFSKPEPVLYKNLNSEIEVLVKLITNSILTNKKYFGVRMLELAKKCNQNLF